MSEQLPHSYRFGDYRIETNERLLKRLGLIVPLPPKALDLLFVLLENNGCVVTKEKLMSRVWADSFVEEANLSRNVFLLRKILGDGNGEKFIQTIPKRGYRFAAEVAETNGVETIEITAHERTQSHIVIEEEYEIDDVPEMTGYTKTFDTPALKLRSPRRSAYFSIGIALTAAAIFGLAAYTWKNSRDTKASPARSVAMHIKRLTTNGSVVNTAISPDGKFFVYALAESNGQSLWVQQTASPQPVNISPVADESYWGLTISPDGTFVYCSVFKTNNADLELRRIPVFGGFVEHLAATPDTAVSFAPDGSRMAWTEGRGGRTKLYTAAPDGSDLRLLTERKYPSEFNVKGTSTAWSHDGATIACASKDIDQNGGETMSVIGVDAATGAEKPLTARCWASVNHISWIPDVGLIVIASETTGSPAQIWSLSLSDDAARQLTNDLSSYERLSTTADGETILSIQRNSVDRLYAKTGDDPSGSAASIARQVGSFDEIAWTADGRIAYFSFAGGETNLWVRNADGTNPRQLTTGMQARRGLAVSPDNRFIVFAAGKKGKLNLWRTDIEGRNLTQLTHEGGGVFPAVSPDGKWVVYQQGNTSRVLRKVPMAGGPSVVVTEMRGARPQISPDGKLIAFFYIDDSIEPNPLWCIGIVSAEDGQFRQKFTILPTVYDRFLRWTPDGKFIAYISNEGENGKITTHPLYADRPPGSLLFANSSGGVIQAFAWSPNGRQFAFTRESQIRDAVLLNSFKQTAP